MFRKGVDTSRLLLCVCLNLGLIITENDGLN